MLMVHSSKLAPVRCCQFSPILEYVGMNNFVHFWIHNQMYNITNITLWYFFASLRHLYDNSFIHVELSYILIIRLSWDMKAIHIGTTCAIFCCIWNMRYFLLLMQQQVNSKSLPSMHDKYGWHNKWCHCIQKWR